MKTENRLLRLPEVLERVPFGKTTLYRLQSEGSFPQGIQLGSKMVAWVASDIDKWVSRKIKEANKK